MTSDLREQFEQTMRDSILIEVETGIAFASISLDSTDGDKRLRNCRNARKAYDTALYIWAKHPFLKSAEQQRFHTRLSTLRHLLLRLGETSLGMGDNSLL